MRLQQITVPHELSFVQILSLGFLVMDPQTALATLQQPALDHPRRICEMRRRHFSEIQGTL